MYYCHMSRTNDVDIATKLSETSVNEHFFWYLKNPLLFRNLCFFEGANQTDILVFTNVRSRRALNRRIFVNGEEPTQFHHNQSKNRLI